MKTTTHPNIIFICCQTETDTFQTHAIARQTGMETGDLKVTLALASMVEPAGEARADAVSPELVTCSDNVGGMQWYCHGCELYPQTLQELIYLW